MKYSNKAETTDVIKKRVGVVADDITGANDIGLTFTKGGYSSAVFPLTALESSTITADEVEGLDVVIIDTDSRFDRAITAADKVLRALDILKSIPCDVYFNKTCSVFRGNIGAEFDAMQDALGISCSMVIAGFPHNGRTTIDGIHYVNGILLSETQFKNDPIHPMKVSSLREIISGQSDKNISNISVSILDQGISAVVDEMMRLKEQSAYIVFDIRDQKDLALVAEAVKGEMNICGSSAIGEELPRAYNRGVPLTPITVQQDKRIADPCGVLLIAGSLTEQTREQVSYMRDLNHTVLEFHTELIFVEEDLVHEIERIVAAASEKIAKGYDALIHTSQSEDKIENTRIIGQVYGMSNTMIGKRISSSLFRITNLIRKRTGFRKLVVAGGDTSAAISGGLGVRKMLIAREVAPGVPNMFGIAKDETLLMVLKSGSFGQGDFLQQASAGLRNLGDSE
jgi:3-dehydrotetronate 4-kinase